MVGVAVVALAVAVVVLRAQSNPCRAVDELVAFNQSQLALLQSRTHTPAAGSRDEPSAPSESDYQAWAEGMQQHAAEVTKPELAEHAQRAAELAEQTVVVIRKFRSESSSRDVLNVEPPPSAKAYGEVTTELRGELQALESACPRR